MKLFIVIPINVLIWVHIHVYTFCHLNLSFESSRLYLNHSKVCEKELQYRLMDNWTTGELVTLFCDKWNKATGDSIEWIDTTVHLARQIF